MTTDTADRIVAYLRKHTEATPNQIRQHLGIGRPALFRQLKKLVEQGKIAKAGSPPKVFYFLPPARVQDAPYVSLEPELAELIEENFFLVSPLGHFQEGVEGFAAWCASHGLPVAKTAAEYRRTLRKYQAFSKDGLIDGLPKLNGTFEKVYLDKLYYLDFYSIERFGKTRLGSLLLHAKQSQSPELIKRLIALVKPRILRLVRAERIMAVGFVPPTVLRTVQLQKELEKGLALGLPTVEIAKATGPVRIAQKTLSRLEDRVENARGSIFVESLPAVSPILLVDDAVGSGASLNETARKIKEKNPKAKVIGLAVTGSFKGFDVLNEV